MTAVEAINEFVETMLDCRETLDKIEGSDGKLSQCITKFADRISDITKPNASSSDNPAVKDIQESQTETLREMLRDVGAKMDATRENMKFIVSNKESFNIAVFGKVKAGKSYTGNFIMGNVIRSMGIKTSYDNITPPKVTVYDRGKITSAEKLAEIESNDDGFIVDPNEATSTIQLFTLGGMKWIDTPGIGSVTQANELLAQNFVDSADLVVYMSNSDAAGTQQDFKELETLHKKGRRFLLLLTQSDTLEEDCDGDGNIISTLVPKSDKDRRSMEDYICETLKGLGINELQRGREILTISTKLALEALKNNDEAMFDASNLKKFLAILIDITRNESADLKLATPAKRIISAIDAIIEILIGADHTLSKHSQSLRETEERLTDNNETLLAQMKNDSYMKIESFITRKAEEVEKGGASVSASDIEREINSVVYNSVMNACAKEFSGSEKILSSYSESLKIQAGGDVSMRTDTITHTQRKVERERRDPTGLWENIGSFFGKEYYSTKTRNVTITTKIDLGVNTAQVMSSIRSGLDEVFMTQIPEMMKKLADEIISPVRDVQEKAKAQISETIKELEGEKKKFEGMIIKIADTHTKG